MPDAPRSPFSLPPAERPPFGEHPPAAQRGQCERRPSINLPALGFEVGFHGVIRLAARAKRIGDGGGGFGVAQFRLEDTAEIPVLASRVPS